VIDPTPVTEPPIHARDLEDGSYRVLDEPRPGAWHRPQTSVPAIQWSPRTGITRYEWSRRHTPERQAEFFKELRKLCDTDPPTPLDDEDMKAGVVKLPNGLRGVDAASLNAICRKIHTLITPDNTWRFSVMAERRPDGGVIDVLLVSHVDFRTLADWELIVRFRSWVFDDERQAVILLPGTSPENLESFRNDRSNAIQILSARDTPQGLGQPAHEPGPSCPPGCTGEAT
jgi:hypothetical protein